MKLAVRFALLLLRCCRRPALAQDPGMAEVIVTGSRITDRDEPGGEPARRSACAAPPTSRSCMSASSATPARRDRRREEILTMVRSAIDLAGRSGIELATGDFFVVPLTAANYRTLADEQ